MKSQVVTVALVALVACKSPAGDDYEVQPPGMTTHPGSNDSPDAAVTGSDGGTGSDTTTGRVCLAADSRKLTACAGSGAGGLTVTFGSATAITADDGSYAIPSGGSAGFYTVSGALVTTSVKRGGPGGEIPALTAALYGDMNAGTNNTIIGNDQGAVIFRVLHAGAPVAAASVESNDALSDIYFDSIDDTQWANNRFVGTGPLGEVWIPVEPAGTIDVRVDTEGGEGSSVPVTNIPIVDQAITYIDVTIP